MRFKVSGGIWGYLLNLCECLGQVSGEMEVWHFLVKSALRVSTPSALLSSVLSKAGWSVSMTWNVRLQVVLPLLALSVIWPMGLIGGLA